MERILKLSTGHMLSIQDSTEGGFDYTLLDGKTLVDIDGGLIDTGNYEGETPITDEIIKSIIIDCFCGLNTRLPHNNINDITWVDSNVTQDDIDDASQKDFNAGLLMIKYYSGNCDLKTLRKRIVKIFGNIKDALVWLTKYARLPKYQEYKS